MSFFNVWEDSHGSLFSIYVYRGPFELLWVASFHIEEFFIPFFLLFLFLYQKNHDDFFPFIAEAKVLSHPKSDFVT